VTHPSRRPSATFNDFAFHLIHLSITEQDTIEIEKLVFLCRTEEEKVEWTLRLRDTIEHLGTRPGATRFRASLLERLPLQDGGSESSGCKKSKFSKVSWWRRKSGALALDWHHVRPEDAEIRLCLANKRW
jgi:hypothetical protein